MKPIQLLTPVTMIALMAFSTGKPIQGKMKSFYSSQNRDTISYHYDADGRLSNLTTSDGYKTSYEYKDNVIIENADGGRLVTMYLNDRGLIDSLTDLDPMRAFENESPQPGIRPGRAFPYSGIHILTYLNSGPVRSAALMSKKFVYDDFGFQRQETAYVNGKLWAISNSVVEGSNIISYTIKYFFCDTITTIDPVSIKEDTKIIKLSDRSFSLSYDPDRQNSLAMNGPYGKCSKNLVLRDIGHDIPLSPTGNSVTSYKYTFDKKGRITTLIEMPISTDPPQWDEDVKRPDTCSFTYY